MITALICGLALIAWVSLRFLIRRVRKFVVSRYPTVPATIESAGVYENLRKKGDYVAGVFYRYHVGGQLYSAIRGRPFSTVKQAHDFLS